jgi:YD repeat-containing protein
MRLINIVLLIVVCFAPVGCVTKHTNKPSIEETQSSETSSPQLPADYSAGHRRVFYVWANGELVASIDQDGNRLYYHNDPWGKPQVITDSKGKAVWRKQKG